MTDGSKNDNDKNTRKTETSNKSHHFFGFSTLHKDKSNAEKSKPSRIARTEKKSKDHRRVVQIVKKSGFQRAFFLIIAMAAVYFTVLHGAAPQRYRLEIGDISTFDINAPREIVNVLKTEELANAKAAELEPVIIADERANIDMLNGAHALFDSLDDLINSVRNRVIQEAVAEPDDGYFAALFRSGNGTVYVNLLSSLNENELASLAAIGSNTRLTSLKAAVTDRILADISREEITTESIADIRKQSQAILLATFSENPWAGIGTSVLKMIIVPNSYIDKDATNLQRESFISGYIKDNPVMISKDERIINKDDIVTADKWKVLKELNYIESDEGLNIGFYIGIFLVIAALSAITIMFIHRFQPSVYKSTNLVALTSVVVVLVSLIAWIVQEFLGGYAPFLLPIFIAPILLSTLVGLEVAIIINAVLSSAFMIMFGGDASFGFMGFVGGSFAAFMAHQASQRRKLSISGVLIGIINATIIVAMGILSKESMENMLNESGLVFLNGLLSMILAIGLLPFFEGLFNVITPFKLLELADPNHPVIKRLLVEAPGTYHHSLMVGNMAEAAVRSLGGNALLARVGAYFHDIGKLKRPNFFKENQLSDNPHEKLTPNLSTLVITSHTRDGDELAQKYRLPRAIRDIIVQHHGTTLVAFFYHKAKQMEKGDEINRDSFRYEGPLPDTKESAVVMLADSIEAAVRSMPDKTPGKMEGLLRKIIKDKLEDGQLDRCDLTLRDLSLIADNFITVLGGVYHERVAYPEIEKVSVMDAIDNQIYNATMNQPQKAVPADKTENDEENDQDESEEKMFT